VTHDVGFEGCEIRGLEFLVLLAASLKNDGLLPRDFEQNTKYDISRYEGM
jgi:hypothetical protein